jgi:exodeoxyribonuclease VII large subunit
VVKNAADVIAWVGQNLRRLANCQLQTLRERRQRLHGLDRGLVDPKRYLQDLGIRCDDLMQRLDLATANYLSARKMQVALLTQKMVRPEQRLRQDRKQLDHLASRLRGATQQKLIRGQHQLQKLSLVLDSLSPLRVVERGYSIVSKDETVVKDARTLQPQDLIRVRFAKGQAEAIVKNIFEE